MLADLSSRTKLKLSGPDRTRYLQGQITNDLSLLPDRGTLEACICNAKGGLEAHVFIREHTQPVPRSARDADPPADTETFYIIDAPPPLRKNDTLLNRLEKYLIADDCAVADVSNDYGLVHLIAPEETPGNAWIACNRFGPPGLEMLWSTLHDSFHTDHPLSPPETLETLRIAHGIPRWGAELTPGTLPPEAGPAFVERNISYTKGCYVGQEVISRIKSVGRVNKQLVTLVAREINAPLESGLTLYTENSEKIGEITSSINQPNLLTPLALGYVKTAFASPETPVFAGTDAEPLAFPLLIKKTPLIWEEITS